MNGAEAVPIISQRLVGRVEALLPSMRNLLDKASAAQAWTASRLMGSLHVPILCSLSHQSLAPQ